MTDTTAPERIWAEPTKSSVQGEWFGVLPPPQFTGAEYVRADTVQALIAEAVEAQREANASRAQSLRRFASADPNDRWLRGYDFACDTIAAAIRSTQGEGQP